MGLRSGVALKGNIIKYTYEYIYIYVYGSVRFNPLHFLFSVCSSQPSGQRPGLNANQNDQRIDVQGVGNLDLIQEIMRTFNETNILRRNRRLIFQQNARFYLEQVRFNQTESFDVLRRTMNDIQFLFESKLSYEEAQRQENLAIMHDNRRFVNRQGQQANVNPENFRNV